VCGGRFRDTSKPVGAVAERGIARERTGAGNGGYDPGATLESGGERDGECAAGVGAVEFDISAASIVSAMRTATGVRGDWGDVSREVPHQ